MFYLVPVMPSNRFLAQWEKPQVRDKYMLPNVCAGAMGDLLKDETW